MESWVQDEDVYTHYLYSTLCWRFLPELLGKKKKEVFLLPFQVGKEEGKLSLFADDTFLRTKSGEFNNVSFWAPKTKRNCSPSAFPTPQINDAQTLVCKRVLKHKFIGPSPRDSET